MFANRQIALFLTLVALSAGTLNLFLFDVGDVRRPEATMLMLSIMWTPALAAVSTRLATTRSLRGLGLGSAPLRYFAVAYLATFAIIAIPFLAAIATGHGTVTMQWWPKAASNWGLPATPLAGFVMLATVNVLFAMIAAWGEELGWRGFMVPLLAERHGLLAIAAITWGVTLLYHLPAIWGAGYRADATPLWYSVACFAAMLFPLCVFMAWLRLRSGSVWPCVLAHGAHNSFVQEMWPSAVHPDAVTPWLVGEFGVLTPIAAMLILPLLLGRGRAQANS